MDEQSVWMLMIYGADTLESICFLFFTEVTEISKETRINDEIRAEELRVIDDQGNMIGIISLDEALQLAEQKGLDLVEISPNANPPVAKILDYGKYRYDMQKREKEAKKKQKTIQVKEIRLSTFIQEHDVQVKAKTACKFLKDGDKVKVSLRFRGRERDYVNKGRDVMNAFADACAEVGVVDRKPSFEGRSLTMFLSPKPAEKQKKSKDKDNGK
jgi:translation initiation factor IF-3